MTTLIPFDKYGRYYDLLYRDKDYIAEVDYIISLLTRYGCTGPNLLEFGSGTGRHGRLLAEQGYRVTGIERSPEMVAQAGSAPGFSCQVGDICTINLGQSFDAVLSLFHVMSYQTRNHEVQAVFSRAKEHLQPGGLFIFDIWYSPAVYTQSPSVRVKRMSAEDIEVTRLAEPYQYPNENRVDVNYTIFVHETGGGNFSILSETHSMRHFSLPELDLIASSTGFERICAEEFLSRAPPSEKSWGLCLVLRKY